MTTFVKDMRWLPREAVSPLGILELFDGLLRLGDQASAGFWRQSMMTAQMLEGSQLWVAKAVTDDLLASSIEDPDFATAFDALPAKRLEVVFEDPALPGLLLSVDTRNELVQLLKKAGGVPELVLNVHSRPNGEGPETRLLTLMTQDSQGAYASVAYSAVDMDEFARTGEDPLDEHTKQHAHPVFNAGLRSDEVETMVTLTNLVHKLCLFLVSEGGSPATAAEKPTRAEGGKPGFKGRPKPKNRWKVTYLPAALKLKAAAAKETGGSHQFLGRLGFFRVYRHERFTTMRGRRVFIHPVPGPDGKYPRRKFVVK